MLAAIMEAYLSTRTSALGVKVLRFNLWHFHEELVRFSANDVNSGWLAASNIYKVRIQVHTYEFIVCLNVETCYFQCALPIIKKKYALFLKKIFQFLYIGLGSLIQICLHCETLCLKSYTLKCYSTASLHPPWPIFQRFHQAYPIGSFGYMENQMDSTKRVNREVGTNGSFIALNNVS